MSTTILALSTNVLTGVSEPYRYVAPTRTAPARPGLRDLQGGLRATAERVIPVLACTEARSARLGLVPIGFLPVTLIAVSMFDVVGLKDLALTLLLPAVIALAFVMGRSPVATRLAFRGVAVGVVATALYDIVRFGFLFAGLMHKDPIPHIGSALGLEPAWVFGYLWRYLGNGSGMAIAFFALGLKGVRQGAIYGLLVCAGLVATLVVAPNGQEFLFPLNPTTIVMATVGHLVYGVVLGWLGGRVQPVADAQ